MSYQISIRKKALQALEKIDEGYRVRVGDYRIIYEVMDKVLLIEVVQLRHRKDIYQ
ncbi:MAG: hypothetical protein JST83_03840 [Bacteroidetes bacterium]|nr:hypothetical protein [Bacteroidota bacterium]